MIELGKLQKLIIVKIEHHGAYLGETQDAGPEDRILLPAKQIPEGSGVGDEVRAFVYRDSQDRLIATTVQPKVLLHGVALLKVSQVTKIGAFLDWGLEKDLLLPFHEQTKKVKEGEPAVQDRRQREGHCLPVCSELRSFIAVDNMYSGMIPKREAPSGVYPGDVLELRVTNVKEDGKLISRLTRKPISRWMRTPRLFLA